MKKRGTIIIALEYEEKEGTKGVVLGCDSKLTVEAEDPNEAQQSIVRNKLLEITKSFYLAGSGEEEYFPHIVNLIQEKLTQGKIEDPTIEEMEEITVLVFNNMNMRDDSIREDDEELEAMAVMVAGCGPDGNPGHFVVDTTILSMHGRLYSYVDEKRYSAIGFFPPALQLLSRTEKDTPSSNFEEAYSKVLSALNEVCEKHMDFCSPPFYLVNITSNGKVYKHQGGP